MVLEYVDNNKELAIEYLINGVSDSEYSNFSQKQLKYEDMNYIGYTNENRIKFSLDFPRPKIKTLQTGFDTNITEESKSSKKEIKTIQVRSKPKIKKLEIDVKIPHKYEETKGDGNDNEKEFVFGLTPRTRNMSLTKKLKRIKEEDQFGEPTNRHDLNQSGIIKKKKILIGKTIIDIYCQKLDVKTILEKEQEIKDKQEIISLITLFMLITFIFIEFFLYFIH